MAKKLKAEEYKEEVEEYKDDYYEEETEVNEDETEEESPNNFKAIEEEEEEYYEEAKKTFRRVNSSKYMGIVNVLFVLVMIIMLITSIDIICITKYKDFLVRKSFSLTYSYRIFSLYCRRTGFGLMLRQN